MTNATDRTRYDWQWFRTRQDDLLAEEIETTRVPETQMAEPDARSESNAPDTIARAKEDELVLLGLMEDLESEVVAGSSIPLTNRVVVSKDALFYIIDQMRETLPKTILQAEQVKQNETEIIEEARNRALQFVARAQREADTLIGEERIVIKARERAQEIVAEAEEEAERVRADAQSDAETMRRQATQDVEETYARMAGTMERILHQLKA